MKKAIGISLLCLVALLVVLPGCTAAAPGHIVIARTETSPEIVYVETGAAGGGVTDHAQYLRTDGTRALSGAWDMGSQNLTNVNIDGGTIDGVTITSPAINGTISTSGLTMPAFTLGGTMDANSQALINVLYLDLGTESAAGTFDATLTAANAGTAWLIRSSDSIDVHRVRLGLSGGVDTAVWAWEYSTHTGIVLSGALDANSNLINNVTDPSGAQDAATKNYVDDNDVDATRECWFPVTRADDMNQTQSIPGGHINAAGERAWMPFHIPHDFISITEAVVLINPLASATHRFDITSTYAADGEAYNTHSEADNDKDVVCVSVQLEEIDVSGVLSSLAAGDYGGVKLHGDAVNTPNALVIGLRIKYE